MEEAHTFLSRPPNFVSLQELQEVRLKEKRAKEEEEERQQRLLKEEEERKKLDDQQEREREERIRKSNGKKKSYKQLKIRDESSSKSQDQDGGSEKSKQKSGSQRKKEWTKKKIERKRVESAKVKEAGDEVQNAVEKGAQPLVGEEKESGDDPKEKLEANWVWRKKSVDEAEMVSGGDEIKKRNGEVDVSPNLVTEADMVKKIEAITVISGDDDEIKEEKKRNERPIVNRGFGGSKYGRKMVGTSSRRDENLIWVKKEQATSRKTGLRYN